MIEVLCSQYVRITTLICLAFFLSFTTMGQVISKNIKFSRIGVDQGLSNSTVTKITQDKKGFLWVGTTDGLNKYDGFDFEIYRNSKSDSLSLSTNYVLSLYEDSEGTLWVGTEHGGLQKFDRSTNGFKKIKEFVTNSEVHQITQDADNRLLISGVMNDKVFIAYLDRKTGAWSIHYILDHYDAVRSFFQFTKDELLIGLRETGLMKFNLKTNTFESFHPEPKKRYAAMAEKIICLL
jgi:ligand-binding sensor domain-containing protein